MFLKTFVGRGPSRFLPRSTTEPYTACYWIVNDSLKTTDHDGGTRFPRRKIRIVFVHNRGRRGWHGNGGRHVRRCRSFRDAAAVLECDLYPSDRPAALEVVLCVL